MCRATTAGSVPSRPYWDWTKWVRSGNRVSGSSGRQLGPDLGQVAIEAPAGGVGEPGRVHLRPDVGPHLVPGRAVLVAGDPGRAAPAQVVPQELVLLRVQVLVGQPHLGPGVVVAQVGGLLFADPEVGLRPGAAGRAAAPGAVPRRGRRGGRSGQLPEEQVPLPADARQGVRMRGADQARVGVRAVHLRRHLRPARPGLGHRVGGVVDADVQPVAADRCGRPLWQAPSVTRGRRPPGRARGPVGAVGVPSASLRQRRTSTSDLARIRLQPHSARSAICSSQSAPPRGASRGPGWWDWRTGAAPGRGSGRPGRAYVQRRQLAPSGPDRSGPAAGPPPRRGCPARPRRRRPPGPGPAAARVRRRYPPARAGGRPAPAAPRRRRRAPRAACPSARPSQTAPSKPRTASPGVQPGGGASSSSATAPQRRRMRATSNPAATRSGPVGDSPRKTARRRSGRQGPQRFGRAHRSSWSSCTPRSSSSSVASPSLPMLCIARRGT